MQPELLLRKTVLPEYQENSIQVEISDLQDMLQSKPGVWWNAYSQKYGVAIREFPYEARNGFFFDVETRMCTHRFLSKGLSRRDKLFSEPLYRQLVLPAYQLNWFDQLDAQRTYAILITEIAELPVEIPIEEFGLWNSWGKVSSKDKLHHPRVIKPSWKMIANKYNIDVLLGE